MLTEPAIARARPHRRRRRRLSDGRGLYVVVRPDGKRLWRFDYRYAGRRKGLSFGIYPIVTLARAREKHEAARELLARGIDPSVERRRLAAARRVTFGQVAAEWLAMKRAIRAPRTITKITAILDHYLLPAIGKMSMMAIEPVDVLAPLRRIEARGFADTAHTARSIVGQIGRYAVATGRADRDVTADLAGALTPVQVTHYAALTNLDDIGRLMCAIDGRAFFHLLAYVFVRPGELRAAEWNEINLDDALWRIPAARMKMRVEHLVPLSRQVVAILRELHALTGAGRLLFPSRRHPDRPILDARHWLAFRALGFGPRQTLHGFRTIASTRLNELGWDPQLIELQLAHIDVNAVRAAYNRSVHLEARRAMMQAYADHLDALRAATG